MRATNQYIKRANELVSDCNAAYEETMQNTVLPLLSEAESNIFAMREVADAYRVGSFLPQSDDMYYHYLNKILVCDMGKDIIEQAKNLCADLDNGMIFDAQYERYGDVYECSDLIAYAAFDLGLRYYKSSTIEEAKTALDYFKIADILFRISGPGVEQYVNVVSERLQCFDTADSDSDALSESDVISDDSSNDIATDSSSVVSDNFISRYQHQLSDDIEESIWCRLDTKSQVYISTAFFCYQQFKDDRTALEGEIDYSPVVSLLSKALELELKKRFYCAYLEYLHNRFNNANEYITYNSLIPLDNKAVLKRVGNGYEFRDHNIITIFSLGSFPYIIANGTHDNNRIYPSAIDYCRDVLFTHDHEQYRENTEEYNGEIEHWLHEYITEVETVRPLRNASSHPNSVLIENDAIFCQDYIIRVNCLISKLIKICVE